VEFFLKDTGMKKGRSRVEKSKALVKQLIKQCLIPVSCFYW